VTTDTSIRLSATNGHAHCLLCGNRNPWSFGLSFESGEDNIASAKFQGNARLQGYDGILHGGIVAALLDAAMTHCLFHNDVQAVTADMQIRFVEQVPCDAVLDVRAWMLSSTPPLHRLRAELIREGRVMAWAEAKFVQRRLLDRVREQPEAGANYQWQSSLETHRKI
jgi:acyl-coenzyme A thioesterase PaaI-like protein